MPLSDDQKALLRLLAQREEGYEDIAALMGLSVAEVRSRVKDALVGLDEAGAVVPESSSSAERVSAPQESQPAKVEGPRRPEEAPATLQAETAPSKPAAAAPANGPERSPASVSPPRPRRPRTSIPRDRRRLTELLGGALVILLIVLFATGAVDIGGDDSGSNGAETATSLTETAGADSGKLTQAVLEPVDGGDARGQALFGRLRKEVVLQVVAEGLEPTAPGESYTVWLYRSPKLALRVGAVQDEKGQLAARFPVPAELLAFVANGAFTQIYLSRTSDAAYKAEAVQAKQQQRLPSYTGETVLRGEIVGPLAEAAKGS